MAVVIGREEITVGRVADGPHVYPVSAANVLGDDGGHSAEEVSGRGPAGGVADVGVRRICSIAILVDEVPELLWSKVEDLGGSTVACADGSLVQIVESGRIRLVEVGEAQIHQIVARAGSGTREDMIRAIVLDDRGIFERSQVTAIRFGPDERST